MNPDPLEKKLRGLPQPSLPPEWRERILARAEREAETAQPSAEEPRVPWWEWLLPPRPALVPLAAAWVLIALLRWSTPSSPPMSSVAQMGTAEEQVRLLVHVLNGPQRSTGTAL